MEVLPPVAIAKLEAAATLTPVAAASLFRIRCDIFGDTYGIPLQIVVILRIVTILDDAIPHFEERRHPFNLTINNEVLRHVDDGVRLLLPKVGDEPLHQPRMNTQMPIRLVHILMHHSRP